MKQASPRRLRPQHLVGLLLAAWAVGLAVAAWQLQAWQQDISRVLIQLRADELLRSSMRATDPIRPEWHRQRALALLSGVERLHEKAAWTFTMPGSWSDDLQQRVAQRIDRAFGDVVIDTIRRELDSRGAALSGVPLEAGTGRLQARADCAPPPRVAPGGGGADPQAGFQALSQSLGQWQELDRALGALVTLRDPATARPEDMRRLVRYALHADLSGPASRSLSLFHAKSALPDRELEALAQRLQRAAWCSVGKRTQALFTQWFDDNELLAVEGRLAQLSGRQLFAPASASNLTASVDRLRTAAWLIDREAALVANGSQQWMRSPALELEPAQQQVLEQIAGIRLLGPRAAAQVRSLAEARHARFRKRFAALFERGHGGLEWHALAGRFELSAERTAMRDGIARLLDAPFMQPAQEPLRTASWADPAQDLLQELQALPEARRRFVRESLPVFPRALQPLVTRYMDDRLAQLAFDQAARYVGDAVQQTSAYAGPLDVARARVATVESTLIDGGTPGLAHRTRDRLERELLQPLALAYADAPTASTASIASPASTPSTATVTTVTTVTPVTVETSDTPAVMGAPAASY